MNYSGSKFSLLVMLNILMCGQVAYAQSPSQTPKVNICYENLSQAYLSLDAKTMVNVYADGGHYISAGSRTDIIVGKPQLSKLYVKYFNRLKKHNSSLDLHFRVTSRLADKNIVSDIGYYVVTIIPPKESKQPAKQHAGKFMITFKSLGDNQWGIWSEANSKAKIDSYINAKQSGDLHFDDYVPISHYQD